MKLTMVLSIVALVLAVLSAALLIVNYIVNTEKVKAAVIEECVGPDGYYAMRIERFTNINNGEETKNARWYAVWIYTNDGGAQFKVVMLLNGVAEVLIDENS